MSSWGSRVVNILKVHSFLIFAIFVFLGFTAYYMGPSIAHCNDTVYGFGDNTSGPIWKYGLPTGQTPLGSFENVTNYPFGESLYSPVNYSALLQSTVLWSLETVAGPVCGYNLVNVAGFFTAALMMYGFIYWLTRNKWIALLAGYAVSFAPYFQYKVGGHPSYGYQALLIAAVWLFFKLIKERKKRDSILLGLVSAACFYWDPYFSLLVISVLVPLVATWLVYDGWKSRRSASPSEAKRETFLRRFKLLSLSAGLVVMLLIPIVLVRTTMSSQINSYVSGARGDVMTDARYCSILPWDYVLPADDNWFVGKYVAPSFSEKMRTLRHMCNPSEYNVSISLAVLGTVALGLVIFIWERLNGRRLFRRKTDQDYRFVVIASTVMILFAAALALPPLLGNAKFPFYYVLQITDMWRIPARLFIVVNIGVITLFAVVLAYAAQLKFFAKNQRRSMWALVILFLLIFVQYQAFAPLKGSRATFSYSKDLSPIYTWLRDQKDIDYIAGYPMDKVGETEAISHYITYQRVHGKKLLNSTLPTSPEERIRFSIKDLTDPQTLPILRYLGVDALEIHGIPKNELAKIPGITVVRYDNFVSPVTGGMIAIAKIDDGPKLDYGLILENKYPRNALIMKSAIDVQYETEQDATMYVGDIKKDKSIRTEKVCFQVKTADPLDKDVLTLKEGGKSLQTVSIDGTYKDISFTIKEGQKVTLHNKTGHNMRIDNLGCK